MAADDGAGGFRERENASRPLERFEPARNLRLLEGKTLGREGLVGFGAELVADTHDPAVEFLEPRAAGRTSVEMRMAPSRRPQTRELLVVQVTATSKTFKK
jgi:hypothetical protein